MGTHISFLFVFLITLYLPFILNISSFEWSGALHNPKNILNSIGYHKKAITIAFFINISILAILLSLAIYNGSSFNILKKMMESQYSTTPIFLVLMTISLFFFISLCSKLLRRNDFLEEQKLESQFVEDPIYKILNMPKEHIDRGLAFGYNLDEFNAPRIFIIFYGYVFIILPLFYIGSLSFLGNDNTSYTIICILLLIAHLIVCELVSLSDYIWKYLISLMILIVAILMMISESLYADYFAIYHTISQSLWFYKLQIIMFIIPITIILFSIAVVLFSYIKYSLSTQHETEEQKQSQSFLYNNKVWLGWHYRFLTNHFIAYGTNLACKKASVSNVFFGKLFGLNVLQAEKSDKNFFSYWLNQHSRVWYPYINSVQKYPFPDIKVDTYFYLLSNNYKGSTLSIWYVFYVTGLVTLFLFPLITLVFLPLYIALQFHPIVVLFSLFPFIIVFWIAFCTYIEWNKYVCLSNCENSKLIAYPLLKELLFQEWNEFYNPTNQQLTLSYAEFPIINAEYMRELVEALSPDIYQKYRERFPYRKKYIDTSIT